MPEPLLEKKTTTSRLSRERIVAAAFRAWGQTHFAGTSLNMVARELGVTKPAVYRYFRGKEELLDTLKTDFATRATAEVVDPLFRSYGGGTAESTPEETIALCEEYLQRVLAFYQENPYHYSFFAQVLLAASPADHPAFRELDRRQEALFSRYIADPMTRRYVTRSAAYWATDHLRRDPDTGALSTAANFQPERLTLTAEKQAQTIEMMSRRLIHGFLVQSDHGIDLEMVERTAWLLPEEMPEPDRVFSAIENVVEEIGYGGATVERIAAAVGITKSSLYHYFRNRNEMLEQVILRDQLHFAGLARIRLQQLQHPREQLYALFVLMTSYAAQHNAFMTVENWLRQNEVIVEISPRHIQEIQRIFAFLAKMLLDGQMVGDPNEAFGVIGFIRFSLLQELNALPRPIRKDRCIEVARSVFTLFARGIGSDIGSMRSSK